MHKSEFIETMAKDHGISKVEAEKAINLFTKTVTSLLAKGQEINLIGFGKFHVAQVAAREGRNPKTGEALKVGPYAQPKFSAGSNLKEECNVAHGHKKPKPKK